MREPAAATSKATAAIGITAGAVGLYFVLVGAGVLPIPGGPGNLHAPLWTVLCAGLAFLLGGAAVVLQTLGRANDQGEFPADAPSWLRVVQRVIGLAIFASLGAVGSWIAFGPGERAFSGSLFFFSGDSNEAIGRIAFGIGAIIIGLCILGFAVAGAARLCARSKRWWG
jgi:hypothetical protein